AAGEDAGRKVIRTSDGGYAVAGQRETSDNIEAYLLKTNANGQTIWEKTYGTPDDEEDAYSVIQHADGTFTVLALRYDDASFLVKTDALGNALWTKSVATGVGCRAFVQTPDNGYALAGDNFAGPDYYSHLIRTDSNGDTLWTRKFGAPNKINTPYALTMTNDGGFVLTGETTSPPSTGENDIFLIKTDANGNLLWDKRFGTPDLIEQGYAVLQTNDGSFVVGGTVIDVLFSDSKGLLIKTDANGDTLWTRQYNFPLPNLFNQIESVALTAAGGYALSGWAGGLTGDLFGFIIVTNAQGEPIQTRQFTGTGVCLLRSVVQAADGEFVATGLTETTISANSDIYLIKTDGLVSTVEPENNLDIVVTPNPAANGQYWQISIAGQENSVRNWTLSSPEGKTLWALTANSSSVEVPVPATGKAFVLTVQSETGRVKSRMLLSVD
ncbi:MAG TPA: hypothetical protein PK228_21850, partial [Saprospiraceae bacterium]|nr:hypothetical protein [Saprospiraceae bacterium]